MFSLYASLWFRKHRAAILKVVFAFGLFALTGALSFWQGYQTADHKAQLKEKDVQIKYLTKVVKQTEVVTKVVTKYVDRVKTIHEKADTIVQEVPIYVTEQDDNRCIVPTAFGMLWESANTGVPIAESVGAVDAAPSGSGELQAAPPASDITLTDISRQHAVEAGYTRELEQQVLSLQEVLRALLIEPK